MYSWGLNLCLNYVKVREEFLKDVECGLSYIYYFDGEYRYVVDYGWFFC